MAVEEPRKKIARIDDLLQERRVSGHGKVRPRAAVIGLIRGRVKHARAARKVGAVLPTHTLYKS